MDQVSKVEDAVEVVQFRQLFQYASSSDKLSTIAGSVLAGLSGLGLPVMIICAGQIFDVFITYESQFAIVSESTSASSNLPLTSTTNSTMALKSEMSRDEFLRKSFNLAYITLVAGLLFFVFSAFFVKLMAQSAANQAHRMKLLFFRSLLRQEVSWFDGQSTGELPLKISTDLKKVEDGIGEKLGIVISTLITGLSSVAVSFYYGWELTLAILIFAPMITAAGGLMAKVQASSAAGEAKSYAAAGSIAQEVFLLIRTVFAYGGEAVEIKRYEDALKPGKNSAIRRNIVSGCALAFMWFSVYGVCAPCIWYGTQLIVDSRESRSGRYTGGTLIIILWNVMFPGQLFGQAIPYLEAVQMARGAAASVFKVIARQPLIDSLSEEGQKLSDFSPSIKFDKVHFSYPSRPDVEVLQGVTLDIREGETVAIVGPSGSGKSTLIQLVQRFSDCKCGSVSVGGVDIAKLNVGWLRQQMGIVGQEPVLFDATIKQNISLGAAESQADDRRVVEAAMGANAHDFISALPARYETKTGERGTQLSGGQKQRIAIARALISKPRVLLLDEATSALDRESESIVQAALDGARVGRTTLIVAHRLTTVQSADRIVFMEKGQIKEIGTHEELIARRGGYYQLFKHQQVASASEFDDVALEHEKEKHDLLEKLHSLPSHSTSQVTSFRTNYGHRDSHIEIILNAEEDKSEERTAASSEPSDDTSSQIKLFSLMKKDCHFLLIGSLGSIVVGLACPTYAIILGDFSKLLENPDNEELANGSVLYALLFVGLALLVSLASVVMVISFGLFGERLTSRLRRDAFRAILRQEMSWFDRPENGVGNLCSRLSSDASDVQGLSGARISTICQSVSTITICLVMSLYLNWKLGLLVTAFIPLIIYSVVIYAKVTQSSDEDTATSKVVMEVVGSIKTATSLHQQEYFFRKLEMSMKRQLDRTARSATIRGVLLGFVRNMVIVAYAAAFALAAYLIAERELHYSAYFKIAEGTIFGSLVVADGMVFGADYDRAKRAAKRLINLIEGSRAKEKDHKCENISKNSCEGKIAFSEVAFRYPTRPDARVLNGLTLDIAKGETVALVGGSGCGKSTTFQLLLNFYLPSSGTVSIDGINLETISTSWLRSKIGLVSQEPLLFDCSIGKNITYGDNNRQVPYEEIVEAARKANIHDFVNSLPDGYDTQVGEKGGQLSGGQKQRIAIARALLRNPAILLLDEATAALDTESERIVQEALDEARQGRTCLMIAHRLSTVRNADKIAVINKGRLVEIGTHAELLAANGHYCRLHNSQAQ